jgi:RNA polymerase sigma factor (sigma-70 family)
VPRASTPAGLDPLRRLVGRKLGCALTDAQLLDAYVTRQDVASFEVLVWRHGAMVLALSRRVLRDEHEAEDAFQATFLVLARKAAAVGRGEAVASWLYKVAYRVALRLRAAAAKRPVPGELAVEPFAPEQPDDAAWRDLRPVLDAEIAALPEKYRAPFVLCYLQGRTNEEAAAQLGCPKGTILSRLSRGREWLRERLSRRGLAPAAVALALNLTARHASATVPVALTQAAVNSALPLAAGAEVVPPHVAALAEGVMRTMIATKLKVAAAALAALAVLGTGIGWAANGTEGEPGDRPAAVAQERPARPAPEQPRAETRLVRGLVVGVEKGGKWFTVQPIPTVRGETPEKVVVMIGEKTRVTYNGVGPNGATPTEGYGADVRFEQGAKDGPPIEVLLTGPVDNPRRPSIVGKVVEATKDGRGVTLEIPLTRGVRGEDAKRISVAFDDKTVLAFLNVGKDGAKITAGYSARVWYAEDVRVAGNMIAGKVEFIGDAVEAVRGEVEPDIAGKVMRAADGKAFVVEVPPTVRGEEPTRVAVKLADDTALSFHNVGRDEAKVAVGLQVRVWLARDSKDTAAKASFIGTVPERWTVIPGKVVAVAKDGTSITIEQPFPNRGQEPIRTEVKLTAATRVSYFNVGPGGAKPTEGLQVSARLLDGSKDTASQVIFSKAVEGRGR